jgi:hypothetical protein
MHKFVKAEEKKLRDDCSTYEEDKQRVKPTHR